MKKKIEVTRKYLDSILQALEDAKGLCEVQGFKHGFNKHITQTKKYIEKSESEA